MVLAVPVVEVSPDRQGLVALRRVGVGAAVGPFAQRGLDKALGLAIGLRSLCAGEPLGDALLQARLGEGS